MRYIAPFLFVLVSLALAVPLAEAALVLTTLVDDTFDGGVLGINENGIGSGFVRQGWGRSVAYEDVISDSVVWGADANLGDTWSKEEICSFDTFDFLGMGGTTTLNWELGDMSIPLENTAGGNDFGWQLTIVDADTSVTQGGWPLHNLWDHAGAAVSIKVDFDAATPTLASVELVVTDRNKTSGNYNVGEVGGPLSVPWNWATERATLSLELNDTGFALLKDGGPVLSNTWAGVGLDLLPGEFGGGAWALTNAENINDATGGGQLHSFSVINSIEALIWANGAGDGPWNSATQWTGGDPGEYPDATANAIIQDHMVTVGGSQAAYKLTVDGGGVTIDTGATLAIGTDAYFAGGTPLVFRADATLSIGRGGILGQITTNGSSTINVAEKVVGTTINDQSLSGTLHKGGAGLLSFNNAGGTQLTLDTTTVSVDEGTLER